MRVTTTQRSVSRPLQGRTALVTGGSRGLGLLIARELGRHGARVVICGRDQARLSRAGDLLHHWGVAEVHTVSHDVADVTMTTAFVQDMLRRFERVDVLVNNAGIMEVGPVSTLPFESFQAAMDTMALGPMRLTLELLPHMTRRGYGRVINITSVGGKVAPPHLLPYAAAKFAAVGFSEGLTAETSHPGVRVTTVVPGLMRTGSHRNASYRGHGSHERTWFGALAVMPLLSMDAERAAHQIVDASIRGRREVILTPAAKLAVRLSGLAPATTVRLSELANRLLPGPAGDGSRALGERVPGGQAARIPSAPVSGALRWLASRGATSARRFNESATG